MASAVKGLIKKNKLSVFSCSSVEAPLSSSTLFLEELLEGRHRRGLNNTAIENRLRGKDGLGAELTLSSAWQNAPDNGMQLGGRLLWIVIEKGRLKANNGIKSPKLK